MSDLFTYLNVRVLGLQPFQVNWLKVVLLGLCLGTLVWLVASRRSISLVKAFLSRVNSLTKPRHLAIAWGTGSALAVILSYVRICQFDQLQTMWDMAVESNVAWHMVHGPWFFNSLDNRNHLGQHFAPMFVLIGLAYRLWESPVTLLILQSVALGLGAVAVYYLALLRAPQPFWAPIMALLYAWNWYLHVNNAHDFHRSVLAIPIFLWMLYGIETGRKFLAGVLAGCVLTVEESMGPILAGVGLYLAAFKPGWRGWGTWIVGVGIGYFLLVTKVFMPAFSPEGGLFFWGRYAHLGPDLPSAVVNMLLHPIQALDHALFQHNQFVRVIYLLLSCGLLPLLAWRQTLLAVIPLSIMLLSGSSGQYNLGHHYTAPALPFLFYSAVYGLVRVDAWLTDARAVSDGRWRGVLVLALVCLGWNIYRVPNYDLGKTNPTYSTAAFELAGLIPSNGSVAADVRLLPIVVNRHRICKVGWGHEGTCDWTPVGVEAIEQSPVEGKPFQGPAWEPDYVLIGAEVGADPPHEVRRREILAAALSAPGGKYMLIEKRAGLYLLRSRTLSAHRQRSRADIGAIRLSAREASGGREGTPL